MAETKKSVPFVDVSFDHIPTPIFWLHHQAKSGNADKYQANEVAFRITEQDLKICDDMSEWMVVILGYKPKVV